MTERGGVTMPERLILFSGPMVRAILEEQKTQTRRIVKPQPPCGCSYIINGAYSHALCFSTETVIDGKFTDKTIWVPPTPTSKDHRLACPYGEPGDRLCVPEEQVLTKEESFLNTARYTTIIQMENTGVRVERLQEITAEDALAEGVTWDATYEHPRDNFIVLWESIYGPGSWAANPWVWVIEFKVVTNNA